MVNLSRNYIKPVFFGHSSPGEYVILLGNKDLVWKCMQILITTHLSNGLTVHLKEIHTAPIISSWMWYRVGSRYELPGLTGLSHWVEHMQFKGTPSYPAGKLDRLIEREGGTWNAFTYLDWTTFYETMPKEKIELAFNLEADRMVNSRFEKNEVESERTVIISEREGSENEPLFKLGEAVQKAAFPHHPYRYEVLGEKADLYRIQRKDLLTHYRDLLFTWKCIAGCCR